MLGGVLGTLARAGVAEWLAPPAGTWPWATFAVNLAGAALLGWLSVVTDTLRASHERWSGPGSAAR